MNHDLFTQRENYKLKTITESVNRRAGLKNFQKKIINTRKSYVCTVCLEKYQHKASVENENQNSNNEDVDEYDEKPVCEDILKMLQYINSVNWDSLPDSFKNHLAGLADHLGKLSDLFEDG